MSTRCTLQANARAWADAIPLIMGARVEVVIHDLASETIAYIANPYSRRKPGDPSNMQDIDFRPTDTIIGPYEKVNWDGSVIRSISVVMRNVDGEAEFVLCINHDQADLLTLQNAITGLLPARPAQGQPEALFRNDWHDRLNIFVSDWCAERSLRIDGLDRDRRRELIAALDASGGLSQPNAASYVARVLGVSRATIYNDRKANAG
ncbi:helix-turn-helix transcriptional regulator [Sulfitobacter pacificus]|uniref:helix-turn-helix transcriptional regulator n=1 Tax=Sulfitobacter pacificus TaxID=1499314 RepID=UPI00310BDC76